MLDIGCSILDAPNLYLWQVTEDLLGDDVADDAGGRFVEIDDFNYVSVFCFVGQ